LGKVLVEHERPLEDDPSAIALDLEDDRG